MREGVAALQDALEAVPHSSLQDSRNWYFRLDLDRQVYWTSSEATFSETEADVSGTPLPAEILAYRACNSGQDIDSGVIRFIFFPDGTREFGVIYLKNLQTGEFYTLFLHPYTQKVKVLPGEAVFNEGQ